MVHVPSRCRFLVSWCTVWVFDGLHLASPSLEIDWSYGTRFAPSLLFRYSFAL
jgi:hypothetical protein